MKIWIFTLALLMSGTCLAIEQKISVPEKGKGSGQIVYTSYEFDDALNPGDSFAIYIDDELAVKFEPTGEFSTKSLTTRVRLTSSSTIKGVLLKKGQQSSKDITKDVEITRGFSMPTQCDSEAKHKKRNQDNDHKILFKHHMSKSCYIKKIVFSGKSGELVVTSTSHLTRNPLFIFNDTSEYTELSVSTEVEIE